MTTTPSHAAPWTVRRFLAMFTDKPAPHLRRANRPVLLSGREATARHLFGESCHWSRLDLLDYDNDARLRGGWLAEADRRIAGGAKVDLSELLILRHWGYSPAQWAALTNDVRTAKRSDYYQAVGLGA